MTHQLHIDVTSQQRRKFEAAVKALGYGTMSSYIRQKIREAIATAEEIEAEALREARGENRS